MRWALLLIAVFAAAQVVGSSSRAGTTVWVVDDGADCPKPDFATIQAAVTAASPGDTILVCAGTYHERVTIATNGLTLRGKGRSEDVVVDADNLGHGILVTGVSGVTIEGFTVREGHDNDIHLLNASGNTIRGNLLTAAVHDGIELFGSDNNLIEHNLSFDNLATNACGINLTAGSDGNLVRHNTVRNNEFGIQLAAANNNVVFDNEMVGNRGNGLRNVAGASGNLIDGNRVFGNGLMPGPVTGATNAGIRLMSGTGLVVSRNHAFDNAAFDIKVEAATATFENNHCNTSTPLDYCAHEEGEGH